MKRQSLCKQILSVALIMSLVGCSKQSASVTEEMISETVDKEATEQIEVRNSEQEKEKEQALEKIKLQLEVLQTKNEQLQAQAEKYKNLSGSLSNEDLQNLVESEIVKCYEENTLLAVETKTLIMGSLGIDVPSGFASADSATRKYEDYITDTVIDGVLSQVASGEVKELLQYGVDGAVESYEENGTLDEALNGALSSMTNGVVAKIQNAPTEAVLGILDETTGGLASVAAGVLQSGSPEEYILNEADQELGGLIGSISSVVNYDTTPGTFLQGLSDSANDSAKEMKEFINKDTVTSKDIGSMMYQYSQFGHTLDSLHSYGGTVSFDWESNYQKMEVLYQRFVRNEIMIEMLKNRNEKKEVSSEQENVNEQGNADVQGNADAQENVNEQENTDVQGNADVQENTETLQETESTGEQPDYGEEYQAILEQVEAIQQENEQLLQQVEEGKALMDPFTDYRDQVAELEAGYKEIMDYSVENFSVEYDTAGMEWMQENDHLTDAIAEISKYTPWGITINIFAACSIHSSQKYYSAMVETNKKISAAYEPLIVDTKESIERLDARITFYSELVNNDATLEEKYRNLCLLDYIQNGQEISLDSYLQDVCENLYILAKQFQASGELYSSIYMDSSLGSEFFGQHDEIMELIAMNGMSQKVQNVSTEKMAEYMIPILEAQRGAIEAIENLVQTVPNRNRGYMNLYPSQIHSDYGARVTYCTLNDQYVHVDGAHWNIYYMGDPFYINSYYIYDGRVLNGNANADVETIIEEANYLKNILSEEVRNNYAEHSDNLNKAFGAGQE